MDWGKGMFGLVGSQLPVGDFPEASCGSAPATRVEISRFLKHIGEAPEVKE